MNCALCLIVLAFGVLGALGKGEMCGGIRGLQCREGEYCAFERGVCGRGDQSGVCEKIPEACTMEYNPVCGCDGVTYGNDCAAWASGVSIDFRGDCDAKLFPNSSLDICGGFRHSFDCKNKDEFCHFQLGDYCGAADATGKCVRKPKVCTEEYAPVCGCDSKTYPNKCNAWSNGVAVSDMGECKSSLAPCGGKEKIECSSEEICRYPVRNCGKNNVQGTCIRKPEVCLAGYSPVCGCNNKTYSNQCTAYSSGVSIAALGECGNPVPAAKCGGDSSSQCGEDQFCRYPLGMCGAQGKEGVCSRVPKNCKTFNPVCGCDNTTYANSCEAFKAEVSIDYQGPCVERTCETDDDCRVFAGESCFRLLCGGKDSKSLCRRVGLVGANRELC